MIAYVSGILAEKSEQDNVIVDVNGIGYNVLVSPKEASLLPPEGSRVKLYTHMAVREDAQKLYGFLTRESLSLFRMLITVNKVGCKIAQDILGSLSPDELRLAILSGDEKTINKCPGVGPKMAQRIILDLKDKIDPDMVFVHVGAFETQDADASGANGMTDAAREALEALIALGFSATMSGAAIRELAITENMTSEDIIKEALKIIR